MRGLDIGAERRVPIAELGRNDQRSPVDLGHRTSHRASIRCSRQRGTTSRTINPSGVRAMGPTSPGAASRPAPAETHLVAVV